MIGREHGQDTNTQLVARTLVEDAVVQAIGAGLTPEQIEAAVSRALTLAEGGPSD